MKTPESETILITGASGFLGWNLCRVAAATCRVVAVVNTRRIDIPNAKVVAADLTRHADVMRLLDAARPGAVVHAAAMADPNACETHPRESHTINVDAAAALAAECGRRELPFAFASTDLVFDGLHAPYREDDAPHPVMLYGRQKVQAEGEIRRVHPRAVICRLPLMFGDPGPAAKSFIQPMIAAILEGREPRLFTDEYRSPVGALSAARGILHMLATQQGTTVHLGGRQRISRYDFGLLLSRLMGKEGAVRLIATRQCDVVMPAARPPDVSLDSAKAYALGYDPMDAEEELAAVQGIRG
jgi:dTDP-4-dehydrorhamnose reductase